MYQFYIFSFSSFNTPLHKQGGPTYLYLQLEIIFLILKLGLNYVTLVLHRLRIPSSFWPFPPFQKIRSQQFPSNSFSPFPSVNLSPTICPLLNITPSSTFWCFLPYYKFSFVPSPCLHFPIKLISGLSHRSPAILQNRLTERGLRRPYGHILMPRPEMT
jgi:hypothetical protein